MFIPPTYQASAIFDDTELAAQQECLCGKTVKVADCIVCYTHKVGSNEHGWYAACNGNCVLRHVSAGSA